MSCRKNTFSNVITLWYVVVCSVWVLDTIQGINVRFSRNMYSDPFILNELEDSRQIKF